MMNCTSPFSSATHCSLQLDEEQPDRWKYSRRIRPQYHHSEHSLSPVGQGCQNNRLEPLECRDLLVQNALFTGDLEMVQKYFTKSAAINLIIETRGDELRWTSRKFEGWWQKPSCARIEELLMKDTFPETWVLFKYPGTKLWSALIKLDHD